MSTSVSAPDTTRFLESLSFRAADLAQLKRAVSASKEVRQGVEAAARAPAGGPRAALRQATALYLLSRPEDALAVLSPDDTSPQAQLLRGVAALEAADPGTASTALASLVGTEMEGEVFFTHLATAAALAGDAATARNAAAKLPEGANALYAEGIALEADGEYEEARQKYEAAVHRDGHHGRALFRLALYYDKLGKEERAIDLYRRCAALNPPPLGALQNLALLYEDEGRYAEAEQCYRRILQGDPQHARARVGLKDVQAAQNQYYDEDSERREDRRVAVLRTPISEFELSVRSRNCLSKMNIQTLGDLVRKSEAELLAYKNFGETSLQEIKDILAQKSLRLGMLPDDEAPLQVPARPVSESQLDALFGGSDDLDDEDDDDEGGEEGPSGEVARMAIEELELSIRAKRCMESLGIHTVGDLLQRSEADLLASKNFGHTSLSELRRKLDALGVTLKRR